jgi:outer membrane receptor protein involved in Fe transport
MLRNLTLAILLLILPVSILFSGTTGKIAGKVTNASTGEPLFAVNVIVEGTTLGAATDMQGNYVILNVPPGVYTVRASAVGFKTVRVTNVRVSVDQTTRVDFKLEEVAIELGEEVVVVAERPLVQRDLTSTTSKVGADIIAKLPVENFTDIINLQAGVVEGHFRGGRLGEVAYMIDGIPVNDVFSNTYALQVENHAIQEMEIVTGTFNAEYGQAMSGVVNIITKEGGERYSGSFSTYIGDYVSSHRDLFMNIERVKPLDIYNLQGTLGGPFPILKNKLGFFISWRYYKNDGWIYGRRIFNPHDSSNFSSDDPSKWYIGATGDSAFVPMNPEQRLTLQGKLSIKINPSNKLNIESLYQRRFYKIYDHRFKYNPDGDYKRYQYAYTLTLSYTNVISPKAFFTIKGSLLYNDYQQYVWKDINMYPDPKRLQDASNNAFLTGGAQMWHFFRNTRTYIAKIDYTNQITNTHQIKTGIETRLHRLWLREYEIVRDERFKDRFVPTLPPRTAFNNNEYLHRPYEFSAYIQDKMEFEYLVANVGVRFDYFEPDGKVLVDPDHLPAERPLPDSLFKRAKPKYQISPRIGLAYPITDRGVIHISYGHFFQIPPFEFLYTNPEFEIEVGRLKSKIGNADLQPERTVSYEIGLQQQLSDDIAIDITGYYKDIRNLLGTQIHQYLNVDKFARYINRDYGNVRGITISLEKRFRDGFGATIDYTLQLARGNASDPDAEFLNNQADPPIEGNKQLVPLDWDRRHSLNFTVSLGDPNNFVVSLIGKLGTGLPYTPAFQNQRTAVENSDNKPPVYTFDAYFYKMIKVFGVNMQFFVKVYNVFDIKNEIEVFGDTGRAGYTLATIYSGRPRGINTVEEYFKRPDFYSEPRQVIFGISFDF